MLDFEWDPTNVPTVKLGLHIAQILLSFVVWCLEIGVFARSKVTGDNGWTFAVCFFSVPAWAYLVMTPRFQRTRRLAQPTAMLVVDALFAVVWLSAFATQAAFNSTGECASACNLSKAIVGLGVLNTLLFAVTTFLSFQTLQYYRSHGSLPGYDRRKIRGGENIDPDKAAFSMAPQDDEEAYQPVNINHPEASAAGDDDLGAHYGYSSPYGRPGHSDEPTRYGANTTRPGNALFDSETEYSSGGLGEVPPPRPYGGTASTALAYSDNEPATFPAANYDRAESR